MRYLSSLRRQGATLMTLRMSLPIGITTNCELFKTPTLYVTGFGKTRQLRTKIIIQKNVIE